MPDTKKIEKEIESKIEETVKRVVPKYVEPIISTLAIIVFYALFNFFYDRIFFFSDKFDQILGLYNFSLIVAIIFNATRIVIWSPAYKRVTTLISNFIFFYLAYKVWTIFPFDFSQFGSGSILPSVFRWVIAVTFIAVLIGTVVETVKLIMGKE